MKTTVQFKDLSWPLKAAIIMAWIEITLFLVSFAYGFVQGWMG